MKKIFSRNTALIMFGVSLIIAIALWTFQPSTKNTFVWDTVPYLIHHWLWVSHINIDNLIWMLLSLEVSNWHPLTWLSWAIDFQIYGGFVPAGFHLTSNILHAINSGLFFVLILVLFGLNSPGQNNYPFRTDNNAIIAAILAALMFALHPQHVESVVWVAERKDLLCQLFMLLSMLAYVKYVTCPEHVKMKWFYFALGLFFLAVLSKPMAVTFPAVLLILDVYPLRRTNLIPPLLSSIKTQSYYKLFREKLPFILLSIILVLITLHAQKNALVAIPLDLRILNASNSIFLYLSKLLLPLHFAPHYPFFISVDEGVTFRDFIPLISMLALTVASFFAWVKGQHAWLIAWLFYLVTLSPVLGIIQVGQQGAADRYAYFTTLPVYMLAGAGILAVLNKTTLTKKLILLLPVLLVLTLLGNKTRQQIQVWKDPHSLWSHAVKNNLETSKAHHNLGIAHYHRQEYESAIMSFEKSLNMKPDPHSALAWKGLSYIHLGLYEKALEDYLNARKLIVTKPGMKLDPQCNFFNTGWLYVKLGDKERAVTYFKKVGEKSKLLPNAKLWLQWLEDTGPKMDQSSTLDALPNFCRTIGIG